MASFLKLLQYVVLFVFFWVSNVYAFFAYMGWMLLLFPLRLLWPAAYWAADVFVFKGLNAMVVLWLAPGQNAVWESGDDVSHLQDKEVLLLANHQSTADVPLTMKVMWPKGWCSGKATWVMDQMFRYTHFGLISTVRGDFFIKQGKESRDQQGPLLEEYLKNTYLPSGRKWIILYPEGGFLHKRREASQLYAKKNGYPVLKHVTLPRIGAVKAILDTLAPPFSGQHLDLDSDSDSGASDKNRPLNWVLDMTIGYKYGAEDNPPDFINMMLGRREPEDIHIHYRAYPALEVPRDSEDLLHWLYNRYEEKERLLEHFYQEGAFPLDEGRVLPVLPSKRVVYDYVSVLFYNLFFLVSCCVFYKIFVQPLLWMFS